MSLRKRKSVRRSFYGKFPKSSPRRRRGSKRATPRAPRNLQKTSNHDLGRLVIFARTSSCRPVFLHLYLLNFLFLLTLSGCGSRRPVVGRQPPPAQPSETPAETAEAAKGSTDMDAPAMPSAPAPSAKRNKTASAPAPAGYTEEGNASWYGVPFHGRHAPNGQIYAIHKLTPPHP